MRLKALAKDEIVNIYKKAKDDYQRFCDMKLSLNMARGKPCADQLDLALGVLEALKARVEFAGSDGDDSRNYGVWNGLPEMREIFSHMMNMPKDLIILGNNSSLMMMFDTVAKCYTHGMGGCTPWGKLDKVKFLCPSPGYDRHFSITEYFGIEMIPVPMLETGPDMDIIERLVESDASIKGCWCVPKYSNPTGITYSDETVRRFAQLKPVAKDFRILWDNAYSVHDLTDQGDTLLDLYAESVKNGTEDQVIIYASTSKISFPGAGVAAMGMSPMNFEDIKKMLSIQTIGPDKLNQLRHIRFLNNIDGVRNLMKGHAKILAPKFDIVTSSLEDQLGEYDIARWTNPRGGYFVSLDTLSGCAKKVVSLCKDAGVILTDAGATFPYGEDPNDCNIRIAPTFPPESELKTAMELLCVCVKIVSCEKILETK